MRNLAVQNGDDRIHIFLCSRPTTERIDHLHYDVIHAKPDGSCSRPAETGPSVS